MAHFPPWRATTSAAGARRVHPGAGFLLLLAMTLSMRVHAQHGSVDVEPIKPKVESTTHLHRRGTDVVEPMKVYLATRRPDAGMDTAYVGIAKVPDPVRNEVGATVNVDLATGIPIRLGGAWLYNDEGLQQPVTFLRGDAERYLVFRAGRHDDVVSMQGARPVYRRIGDEIAFDLESLYASALKNPLNDSWGASGVGAPRVAWFQMKSTYPGGETVDLSIVLTPDVQPAAPLSYIRVVRRDTTILRANLTYEVKEEVVLPERSWTAAASMESGWGQAHLRTDLPAKKGEAFSGTGSAQTFYIFGDIFLRRGVNRWGLSLLGTSTLAQTSLKQSDTHQIGLYADARFEHGSAHFFVMQLAAELSDKQYQVFDWQSADYAASLLTGMGHASINSVGLEKTRVEFLAGVRMGENRRIEILETRDRARGLGPQANLTAEAMLGLGNGFYLRGTSDGLGYYLVGRGHRDDGFSEKGLLLNSELQVGYEMAGIVPFIGLTNIWLVRNASFKEGYGYYENRLLFAPGMTVKVHL